MRQKVFLNEISLCSAHIPHKHITYTSTFMPISAGNGLGDTTGTELPIHTPQKGDPKCSFNPVEKQVRMLADPDCWCLEYIHAIKCRVSDTQYDTH